MTICAAAICKHGDESVVIGIADRMYTRENGSEQIEYQSNTSKGYIFCRNVMGLSAGNGDYALEVSRLTDACLTRHRIEPSGSGTVATVADLYTQNHIRVRNRKAVSSLLSPLNLDLAAFVSGQHGLPDAVVSDTVDKMRAENVDLKSEALIFGVDHSGPHIYRVVEPGEALYVEKTGFQAIGMGARLFETVFMSARYFSGWPLMNALLLSFSAKRQAEMASGVGETTDVFIVRESGRRILLPQEVYAINQQHGLLAARTDQLRQESIQALAAALPNFP